MADLILDEASRRALEERLKSPEGRQAMARLTQLIVESVVEHLPLELLRSLDTKEGKAAFRAAWPEIVDAFLFRRPRPRTMSKSARKSTAGRRSSGKRRGAAK
jgi:hypothetical protein